MKGILRIFVSDVPDGLKINEDAFICDIYRHIRNSFYYDFGISISLEDVDGLTNIISLPEDLYPYTSNEITNSVHDVIVTSIARTLANKSIGTAIAIADVPPYTRTVNATLKAPTIKYYIQWEV